LENKALLHAAKNIILAGVKAVKLYDPSPVEITDLGTQFYLTESDVGKPTAYSCKGRLQELNKAVEVSVLDKISAADLSVQVLSRPAPLQA
jgi:ubiquitin-activating enzyme E1